MRENGVRSLSVSCWLCHHGVVLAVDRWTAAVPVPVLRAAWCAPAAASAARIAASSGYVPSLLRGWSPARKSAASPAMLRFGLQPGSPAAVRNHIEKKPDLSDT
jgi:hypothetical protein